MGSGQGLSVTGGGILGAAEQAGVMAAAIGGFGGGGIAAQIGEQEMNLGIQEAGKAARRSRRWRRLRRCRFRAGRWVRRASGRAAGTASSRAASSAKGSTL